MACVTEELEFDRDGAVFLRAAFDPSGLGDVLWSGLASRHRIVKDDPTTWPTGVFGKLTKFGKSGRFASVGSDAVAAAITDLLGACWHADSPWGAPLITFPMPGRWDVPRSWHIDFPASMPLSAVRMFAYLTSIRPGGGGTVIIAGSHQLAERRPGISSRDLRRDLAERSPWFRDLWRPVGEDRVRRFMVEGDEVDGVHVRVVELTGEPGDVVLWHPALLHAGAPNCLDEPRFMLTHTVYRGSSAVPA
jgi:hypothetical protein